MGHRRDEPRVRHVHRRVRDGLAGSDVRDTDRDCRKHHLRRVVSHDRRALCRVQRLFNAPYDNAPLHAPQTGGADGGDGVYAVGASAYPGSTFQVRITGSISSS